MTPTTNCDSIQVLTTSVAGTAELEEVWSDLLARSDASIFLSWSWIGCWLASLPSHVQVQVVRAERYGLVVGLALLVVSLRRRMGVPLGKAANLHATGLPEYDGVTIEHNGFLLDRAFATATQAAMLRFVCDPGRDWRSVRLPGLTGRQAILAEMLPRGVQFEVRESPCAIVALQPIRDHGGDYLSLLGARRRAHIRRSSRACAEWGALQVTCAEDVPSALVYFERLRQLHRVRSARLARNSNFERSYAGEFHRRLIQKGVPRGEVQILRVHAGERDVGYLYNFVHRGRVSFYQSGFDFDCVDQKFSPGLVTVALAIEHNARLGHDCFDFLAGDAQYKKTLATHSEPMYWVDLRRDGPMLRFENLLRSAVRRCRAWLHQGVGGYVVSMGWVVPNVFDCIGCAF